MAERAFDLRHATMRRAKEGGDLVVDMAFASDKPYERWWGIEILEVSEKAVRLGRLNDGDGGAVLYNHDWNDLRGRHTPGSVRADSDGFLRGQIIIPAATSVTRDTIALVESKTLSKASTGYQIHKIIEQTTSKGGEKIERELDGRVFERLIEEHSVTRAGRVVGGDLVAFQRALDRAANGAIERKDDELPVYRVVDWEPLENSLVTIPADNSVGIGRSFSTPAAPAASTERQATMADTQAAAGAIADDPTNKPAATQPAQPKQGPSGADVERERQSAIRNLCEAGNIPEATQQMWITSGMSWDAVSRDYLAIQQQRQASNATRSAAQIGLTEREAQSFSILRAVAAVVSKDWTKAGFEAEASRAVAQRLGKPLVDPHRFYVPFEVQARNISVPGSAQRDLTVASASGGGYLVGTNNMSFIELMRNRSVLYTMGATRMSGLVGSVTVPKQTAAGTAVWLANEASTITESAQTFGQMSLSPKSVGGYTEISRHLALQSSPDAEGIVSRDLATVCALAVDVAGLRGAGSGGEPQGVVGTSGVGSVLGTSLAAAGVLEFQSDVAAGNLLSESCGYVTTPAVAALLMARPELPSTGTTRLWLGSMLNGSMFGMRAMSSNQMASATMLYGDWSQVVIGEWGVMEVEVNPYANFPAGIVGVRAIVTIDVGVRYGGAFSYSSSIT